MELLKNSGFEKGEPDNWSKYATGTKHIFSYPEIGKTGIASVAIECPTRENGSTASWIQTVNINPTKKYRLSGWIKTKDVQGAGASIKIDWKDSTGQYLSESNIVTRKVGNIPWTNLSGEVTPNPNAVQSTVVLDLKDSSGKVWFDGISLSEVSVLHPNMYLNINEINNIKARKDNEPWRTAYEQLITGANSDLNVPVQSVTFEGKVPPSGDKHDYYTEVPASGVDRTDYSSAIKLGKAVRDLGLAHVLTGGTNYANKVVDLINTWCVYVDTKMNPKFTNFNDQSYIELCITIPGMFYGADLIYNYQGWNDEDKNAFKNWTQKMIESAKTWSRGNNFENWRIVFIMSASAITGDTNSLQYAIDRWKSLIKSQMDIDGKFVSEISRKTSLSYSTFALNAMTQGAEIARHYGVDLYNYKLPDGRGLEKGFDFHAPYIVNPSSWPYQQTTPYDGANSAIYELAYSFKNKTSYKDVIIRWQRPMYETRTMGPVTLTYGSAFR